MELYRRIKEKRINANMSQEELAKKVGYTSRSTVAKIETGKIDIPQSKIVAFANAFNVTPAYLMGWTNETTHSHKEHAQPPAIKIISSAYEKAPQHQKEVVELILEPYKEDVVYVDFSRYEYNKASAGTGCFLSDEYPEIIKVRLDALPRGYGRDPSRYFGVTVSGDSMEPQFYDGDILIVCDTTVNIGEIGVVTMDGEGYIKKIGVHVLQSLNPYYDDIPMQLDMKFCGKVVGLLDQEAIK